MLFIFYSISRKSKTFFLVFLIFSFIAAVPIYHIFIGGGFLSSQARGDHPYISLPDLILTIIVDLPIKRMVLFEIPIMLANIKIDILGFITLLSGGSIYLFNIVEHLGTGAMMHILRYRNQNKWFILTHWAMDDDIVYYAGCEAHQYLERVNMLNEGEERQVMETNQFLFMESDQESEKQMQNTRIKDEKCQKQNLMAIKIPLFGYLNLPSVIICISLGFFSLLLFKRGFFTILMLCGGVVTIILSSKIFKKEKKNKNKLSAVLKDLKDQIPQMKISSQQAFFIWKNLQRLLKPLIDLVFRRKITQLCWRDKQFLQKEFYGEEQFHSTISVYKKLNKLSRILDSLEKQMYWVAKWENFLQIGEKMYVFSRWSVEKTKIQPVLKRYIETVFIQHSENILDEGNEGDQKQEKSRNNKIYYSQLFSSIQNNLRQISQSSQNTDQIKKYTKNVLSLLQLQLQFKKSSFRSQTNGKEQPDSKQDEAEDNEHLFSESLRIKHLVDGNYQLTESGQTQFFINHQIPGQITYLRERLDKILIKKIEQQQRKEEMKGRQEKRCLNMTLYERERRVEGFGMLFQNIRPKKNVQQYYLE